MVKILRKSSDTSTLQLSMKARWLWCGIGCIKTFGFQRTVADQNNDLLLLLKGGKPDVTPPASEQRRKTGCSLFELSSSHC